MDRKEYGEIVGVTDKAYYTNSFHVPVGFPISLFDKINIEGKFHKYTNAGHISYVEFDAPPKDNLAVIEKVIHTMHDADMGYAGINFPIDFCEKCNYSGIIGDECPVCHSAEIRRVRRITGYLSTVDRFNDAKKSELRDRVVHSL